MTLARHAVRSRLPDVRPLDRFSSIKIKLGILVTATVTLAALITWIGLHYQLGPRWTLPLAIIVSMIAVQLLAHGMTAPLREMRAAARSMASGDYSQRVRATSRDEVGQLAQAFNTMAEDLEQVDNLRRELVANVSHELRTPLTVIAGYLETLLDNVEAVNPRWLRALQQMQQQGARMQTLLNDLLLLAKLEATDYPSDNQPVAVDLMLLSIKNDAQALSGDQLHRISLEADPHLKLKGSEAELRSAFSNLVFNAVKYTPAGGDIRIRWWGDEQGAHLAVSDTGMGIEAKHLPRLTERFYRVDSSRASNTGGTGLGLAIVKHVLLRHRGNLEISSVLGKGSTFTCHFAAAQVVQRAR